MVVPNMSDPFFVSIVVVLPINAWQKNAVNNSVTFKGTRNSTTAFLTTPNARVILEGQIGVHFYSHQIVQVNLIHNLFTPHV